MAGKQTQPCDSKATGKPGSDPEAAKAVGGKGDFGVREDDVVNREYASRNTKAADPGATLARAGEDPDGVRVSGAGAPAAGPGSSSAGDVDTDFIGVGTGGTSLAVDPSKQHTPGPDDSDGTSDVFASGPHAAGRNETLVHKVGGSHLVEGGSTVSQDDGQGDPAARGADATNNPARDDDSYAGEISSGEAEGQDNEASEEDIHGDS